MLLEENSICSLFISFLSLFKIVKLATNVSNKKGVKLGKSVAGMEDNVAARKANLICRKDVCKN